MLCADISHKILLTDMVNDYLRDLYYRKVCMVPKLVVNQLKKREKEKEGESLA